MLNKFLLVFCLIAVSFFKVWGQESEGEERLPPIDLDNQEPDYFEMSIQELLDQKVVTSSRKVEKIDDAPNTIYVITKEEIKKRGYKNYKDILNTIPGFNVFHGDFGYFTQVRGVAPNAHNKVAYMLNGRIMNQLIETNHLTGPVSLDNAERVEIIVGPGSILYGPETLLAIVNVITEEGDDNEITLRGGQDFNSSAEDLGYKQYNVKVQKKWDEKKFVHFSFSQMEQEGWMLFDTIDIYQKNFRDKTNRDVGGKYFPSYNLNAVAQLDAYNFQFYSYNSEKFDIGRSQRDDVEGVRIDKVDDFMFRHIEQRTDVIDTRIQLNYTNKRTSRMTYEGEGPTTDLSQSIYNLELAVNYSLGNHYLQTGVRGVKKTNQFNYNIFWDPNDPTDSTESDRVQQFVEKGNNYQAGVYVSEEWEINKVWKVTAATSIDYDDALANDKVYFSPRFSLLARPNKIWISKLMFNTSTHMPDSKDSPLNKIHGSDKPEGVAPNFAKTNELVKEPEQLQALELLNIVYLGEHRISLNVYYQRLNNFISWFNPTTNMGDFEGHGVELAWKGKIVKRLIAWSNFSYVNTDFNLTAEKRNENTAYPSNEKGESVAVPKVTVNTGVDYNFYKTLTLSLTSKYFTLQPATFISYDENETNKRKEEWEYVKNQFYVDASLIWEKIGNKPIDLSFTVQNITNNQEKVAAQWRTYRYVPRGIRGYMMVKFRF